MGAIFRFLFRNHYFLLFLLLEVTAAYLIYNQSQYHYAKGFTSLTNIRGNLYQAQAFVLNFARLPQINDSLANEIARLNQAKPEAEWIDSTTNFEIQDSLIRQHYTITAAKVLNASTQFRNNYIVINKGRNQGILPLSAVKGQLGIIGIVKDVSDNFSVVMPVLHSELEVPAKLKNAEYSGTISWDGNDYRTVQLSDIPQHAPIKLGDTVVTSTFSNVYPEDITIGIVSRISPPRANSIFDIEVQLAEDFKKLSYVWLVFNLRKAEREQLELQIAP